MEESDLREILECPVCTQVPYKTKIFSCQAGHHICQTCYSKLRSEPKRCPNGRCRYSSPPTQLRLAEALVSRAKVKLNCPHGGDGCPVELRGEQLEEHVGECKFRKVHCPETDCQEEVTFSLLDEHIDENPSDHGNSESVELDTFVISEADFKDPNSDWNTWCELHHGVRFWKVLIKRANLWQAWMVMEASPKQAELWTLTLKFQNKKTGMFVETSCPAVPIDWSLEQIIDSGNYLTMTTATVRKLVEENDASEWKLFSEFSCKK